MIARWFAERFERYERFFKRFGPTIICVLLALNVGYSWWEGQQVARKVGRIENRLNTNAVPDRLDRIEQSIGQGVKQNREDLIRTKESVREIEEKQRKVDEKQKKVAATLEERLGISRDEIDGPAEGTPWGTVGREP